MERRFGPEARAVVCGMIEGRKARAPGPAGPRAGAGPERVPTRAAGMPARAASAGDAHAGPGSRGKVRAPGPAGLPAGPEEDLRAFCARLEAGCAGSHQWERVLDEPGRIAYRFTRCLWAEAFRELGEPELGFYLCAADEPAVRACNPRLGFRRTRTLMRGDPECDHVFLVER
jgi:hypothetical protein